jgi:hypothetical protein
MYKSSLTLFQSYSLEIEVKLVKETRSVGTDEQAWYFIVDRRERRRPPSQDCHEARSSFVESNASCFGRILIRRTGIAAHGVRGAG